jgi:hypothetical protein
MMVGSFRIRWQGGGMPVFHARPQPWPSPYSRTSACDQISPRTATQTFLRRSGLVGDRPQHFLGVVRKFEDDIVAAGGILFLRRALTRTGETIKSPQQSTSRSV